MPRHLLFSLLLLSFNLIAQTEYSLQAAQAEISSGDYTHAADILDSLENSIVPTANFYLALGNARFESGRTGEAILAYERGLRLKPGNGDLTNNLRYVREEAGLPPVAGSDFALLRWWRVLGAAMGTTVAYSISIILWWLAVGGVVWWYLYRRRMSEKRRFALLPLSVGIGVLSLLFFALAWSRYDYMHQKEEAILLAPVATLRVAPTSEASAETDLPAGHKVTITDRVNRYVKVRLSDGRQGYLLREEVEII
jgi:tetratricopeptide (TPR) repeat protein